MARKDSENINKYLKRSHSFDGKPENNHKNSNDNLMDLVSDHHQNVHNEVKRDFSEPEERKQFSLTNYDPKEKINSSDDNVNRFNYRDSQKLNQKKKQLKQINREVRPEFYNPDYNFSANPTIRKIQYFFSSYLSKWQVIWQRQKEHLATWIRRALYLLFGILILTILIGLLDGKGLEVVPTKTNESQEFLNGNKATLDGVIANQNGSEASISVTIDPKGGKIDPKKISANITFLEEPKDSIASPTVQVVPTYNNHFVFIVKGLYKDFKAFRIQIHDDSGSVVQYASALSNGSNTQAKKPISKDTRKKIIEYSKSLNKVNKNAPLGNANIEIGTPEQIREAKNALSKAKKNNVVNLLFDEKKINKSKQNLPIDSNPKSIVLTGLDNGISQLNSDIQYRQQLLEQVKQNQKQIEQQKASDNNNNIDKQESGNDDQNAKSNEKENQKIGADIDSINEKITADKKQIALYQEERNKVLNNEMKFDKPKKPEKGTLYNESKK